jgi:cytochrome c oxidase cbb3-type subunit IV
MDINTLRSLVTVTALVVFIGIVIWAWSGRNQAAFDEAARLPLQPDEARREHNA